MFCADFFVDSEINLSKGCVILIDKFNDFRIKNKISCLFFITSAIYGGLQ